MNNSSSTKSTIGMLVLFLAYVAFGMICSIIYILGVHYVPDIYMCGVIAIGYGAFMGFIVRICKKVFCIPSGFAFLFVILGTLVTTYFKWTFFFALNDLRGYLAYEGYSFALHEDYQLLWNVLVSYLQKPDAFVEQLIWFNKEGTWTLGENANNMTGIPLAIIWGVEFVILSFSSVTAALFGTVFPVGKNAKAAENTPLPVVVEEEVIIAQAPPVAQPIAAAPPVAAPVITSEAPASADDTQTEKDAFALPPADDEDDIYRSIADDEKDIYN